ncbi:SDR family NAD(P)-dependent oxidoreductase [Sphaerimonospora thailandensis]|uniref:Oxidoreductase n=1 Tax=Sphaerimonospora thailandensis TaxID=795644 RepID=A0A8J3W175_9ACTN|nr:SDR family oxidoreductase [Sphaerimonospora thailandensis]GIH72422.1 oxidoreductase [Sphaerimonospora thailandensis]
MDRLLRERTVLVTGAGSGIGAATASAIAASGGVVAVNDLDEAAAAQTCQRINDAGGHAWCVPGDVATPDGAEHVIDEAVRSVGTLTGLVNNVGVARGGALATLAPAEWDHIMRIDCSSALYMSQRAYPHLLESGGAIVNISSLCAAFPAPGAGAYNAAKAALITLTQQSALEWGPQGVRVNAIAPGIVSGTNFSATSNNAELAERRSAVIPLRRTGSAEDIAPVCLFLLSEMSRYLTGQVLTVDGGMGLALQTLIPS